MFSLTTNAVNTKAKNEELRERVLITGTNIIWIYGVQASWLQFANWYEVSPKEIQNGALASDMQRLPSTATFFMFATGLLPCEQSFHYSLSLFPHWSKLRGRRLQKLFLFLR